MKYISKHYKRVICVSQNQKSASINVLKYLQTKLKKYIKNMCKINTFNLRFLHKNPKKYVSTPKMDFNETFEIFY